MRKILALYINEMVKISHKISVYIILAIMTLLLLAVCILSRISLNSQFVYQPNDPKSQMDSMRQELSFYQDRLTEVQNNIKNMQGNELINLQAEEQALKNQIDMFQYAIDNEINLFSQNYLATALRQISEYKSIVAIYGGAPPGALTEAKQRELQTAQNYISRLQNVVENKDYKAYIGILNEIADQNSDLLDDEKKIEKELNELRLSVFSRGEDPYDNKYNTLFNKLSQNEYGLLYNTRPDYTTGLRGAIGLGNGVFAGSKPLSVEDRKNLANEIAVQKYRIEHGIPPADNSNSISTLALMVMLQIGMIFIVILMMIIAGSTVSNEISTGSIKSLIIAPVRRWKIWTAKLLSLLTLLAASGIYFYIVSLLIYGAFFGFGTLQPYLFAVNGQARILNGFLYHFAKIFVSLLPVLVYTVFAFMLSIVTCNTAASVGISIAVFFGGSVVSQLLPSFAKGEWVKFVPFYNIEISNRVFRLDTANISTNAAGPNLTLAFSLINVIVILLLMGYTAFDSFTRRDIK